MPVNQETEVGHVWLFSLQYDLIYDNIFLTRGIEKHSKNGKQLHITSNGFDCIPSFLFFIY